MGKVRVLVGLGLLVLSSPVLLTAQVKSDSAKTLDSLKQAVAPDTSDQRALITKRDVLFSAVFLGLTAASTQLDKPVAQNLGDSTKLPNAFRNSATTALNFFGVPGSFIVAGGLYAVGEVGRVPGLARTGVHTFEAIVLAEVVTEGLKWTVGRERPYFVGVTHPWDISFMRGLKGEAYSSFPSGHASAAFASAAALTSEVSARWPRATVFVAPVLYTAAAMVGWARLSANAHWFSDVFMGAGLGTLSGLKVVKYTHKHPNNFIDRILVGSAPNVVPDPSTGTLKLVWTWRPRLLETGFGG